MIGRVRVLGPAYLDRILRVDGPLIRPSPDEPLDRSVDGRAEFGRSPELMIVDPIGTTIEIDLPEGWPGPRGRIRVAQALAGTTPGRRRLSATSWEDDLGGMGAGYAAAMGGALVTVLGGPGDTRSEAIAGLLGRHGIAVEAVRSPLPADWTLLVTSGGHEDKLAIGFRGCLAPLSPETLLASTVEPAEVLVVAGLPNRLAGPVLKSPGPRLRIFAPGIRNMVDPEFPLLRLIAPVDVLCCNRSEWEALEDREEVAARLSILVVTEGAAGSSARFTTPDGSSRRVRIPAFPRGGPPRDTNRAGEAFGAFFCSTLLGLGWRPESCTVEVAMVREALTRASVAAALTLDLRGFGFPTPEQVDAASTRGIVDGIPSPRYD